MNPREQEPKEYKQVDYLWCGRKFRLKHKSKKIVENNNLTIFAIILYYLDIAYNYVKTIYYKIFGGLYLYDILFTNIIITVIRCVLKVLQTLTYYDREANDCFNSGIKCPIIQNQCIDIYNKKLEDLESSSYFRVRNAKGIIEQCIKDTFEKPTLNDMIFGIIYRYIQQLQWICMFIGCILFVCVIYNLIMDWINNLKNPIKDYLPEVEELDV